MMNDYLVGKKYKLTKRLGKGAFGEIFRCHNIGSKEEFAIKVEPKKVKHS